MNHTTDHRPLYLASFYLTPLAQRMYALIVEATLVTGYIASWQLSAALPEADDLDVVGDNSTPGNAAKIALIGAGLVEEVPDLGSRYRARGMEARTLGPDMRRQQAVTSGRDRLEDTEPPPC